eukprot:COSAG02_NODE_2460_length_8797_cov_6.129915_10_plen_418_part_00
MEQVPVDLERHVDIASMRQVRNDDPQRFRPVRRVAAAMADQRGGAGVPLLPAPTPKPIGQVLCLLLLATICPDSPLRLLRETDTGVLYKIYCLVRDAWRDAVREGWRGHESLEFRRELGISVPSYIDLGYLPDSIAGEPVWPTPNWDEPTTLLHINMMPFIMGDKSSLPPALHKYWPLLTSVFENPSEPIYQTEMHCHEFEGIGKMGYLTLHETEVEIDSSQRRCGLHTESPGICHNPGSWQPSYCKENGISKWVGWGGGHLEKDGLSGGIYMASTVARSTAIWNCSVVKPEAIVPGGDVEHLRHLIQNNELHTPDASRLVWIHDRTPHESLPLGRDSAHEVVAVSSCDGKLAHVVRRQFFRLVAGEVSVWYASHSTANPIPGMGAQARIIYGDKFVDPTKLQEVESDSGSPHCTIA